MTPEVLSAAERLAIERTESTKHMLLAERTAGIAQMLTDLERLARHNGCIAAAWALEKLLSSDQTASGWRDIETAPKTRHEILIYCESNECIYTAYWPDWLEDNQDWRVFGGNCPLPARPSHWLPIPAPPGGRIDVITCPNCGSTMNEGDPCPECDHIDSFEDCQCDFCQPEPLNPVAVNGVVDTTAMLASVTPLVVQHAPASPPPAPEPRKGDLAAMERIREATGGAFEREESSAAPERNEPQEQILEIDEDRTVHEAEATEQQMKQTCIRDSTGEYRPAHSPAEGEERPTEPGAWFCGKNLYIVYRERNDSELMAKLIYPRNGHISSDVWAVSEFCASRWHRATPEAALREKVEQLKEVISTFRNERADALDKRNDESRKHYDRLQTDDPSPELIAELRKENQDLRLAIAGHFGPDELEYYSSVEDLTTACGAIMESHWNVSGLAYERRKEINSLESRVAALGAERKELLTVLSESVGAGADDLQRRLVTDTAKGGDREG